MRDFKYLYWMRYWIGLVFLLFDLVTRSKAMISIIDILFYFFSLLNNMCPIHYGFPGHLPPSLSCAHSYMCVPLLLAKFTMLTFMTVHQKIQDHYSLYLSFFVPNICWFLWPQNALTWEELAQLGRGVFDWRGRSFIMVHIFLGKFSPRLKKYAPYYSEKEKHHHFQCVVCSTGWAWVV